MLKIINLFSYIILFTHISFHMRRIATIHFIHVLFFVHTIHLLWIIMLYKHDSMIPCILNTRVFFFMLTVQMWDIWFCSSHIIFAFFPPRKINKHAGTVQALRNIIILFNENNMLQRHCLCCVSVKSENAVWSDKQQFLSQHLHSTYNLHRWLLWKYQVGTLWKKKEKKRNQVYILNAVHFI